MASQDSSLRTAQLESAYKLTSVANMRTYQQSIRYANFSVTIGDAVASDDNIVLGVLGVAGKVLPEHCRIAGVTGSVAAAWTLEKVTTGGTTTALTGTATTATDGVCVPFLRASGDVPVAFAATDYLQLTFTEATTTGVAATDVIDLWVAYISEELG